ncbi:hypothetical protein BC827DRAFT_1121669 [Russula dissimulans]|nr:hypothetical protein BC827DRAFT_1121669 [Russula dissimulans]
MVPPPIQIFLTTIVSQPVLRQRQDYILRILQAKNITFSSYDLASDEDAKRLWRRKAPADKQQLPGILIGGTCPGSFADFEEAVEYSELESFLRLNDTWDESIEETRPTLPTKPIGVPGASSPSQMAKPAHRALFSAGPSPSPTSLRKRGEAEFDVSEELSGYGLQGVKVTEDDLLALVQDLGLGGDEAGDLVKGLAGDFTTGTDTGKANLKADKDKGGGKGEATANRDDAPRDGDVGGGISAEQPTPQAESEALEAKPEAAAPVAREEAKGAEGGNDDAGKVLETEVADVAST